jgi:hypothetical protein
MKHFLVKKSVCWICFSLFIYYFILQVYYIYFVSVFYEQFGFIFEFSTAKYIEANLLFILIVAQAFFISRKSEFIFSVFVFFNILFLIPTLIIFSYSDLGRGPLYSIFALVAVLGVFSSAKIKIPDIKGSRLSNGLLMFFLLLILVPVIFNFGFYFNLKNIFLEDVYQTREVFTESSSLILDYVYNWLIKAIVPILFAYYAIRKRYNYAVITLGILLYLYIISGNKIVYITSFIMIFFLFTGKDYFQKVQYFLIALIVGLLLIPVIDYYVLDSHSFKGIFVMRTLFLPSRLNYFYFDFFRDNPLYFAESNLFNFFFKYPYDRPIGFIISETYFNAPDMNANNGIIGDGYMNLGYPGVVLNIIMVSCIFLFFNSLNIDSRYLGLFFVIVFLLLSVPMLSLFITSGLWIIFLMAMSVMKWRGELETD